MRRRFRHARPGTRRIRFAFVQNFDKATRVALKPGFVLVPVFTLYNSLKSGDLVVVFEIDGKKVNHK